MSDWEQRILATLSFFQWMNKEEILLSLELDVYNSQDRTFNNEQFDGVLQALVRQGKVSRREVGQGMQWQRQMKRRKWYQKFFRAK